MGCAVAADFQIEDFAYINHLTLKLQALAYYAFSP